jgi:hypothetical protein
VRFAAWGIIVVVPQKRLQGGFRSDLMRRTHETPMCLMEIYVDGNGCASHPEGAATSRLSCECHTYNRGVSFILHHFPIAPLFSTSSVAVPGTEKGPDLQNPSLLLWVVSRLSDEEALGITAD